MVKAILVVCVADVPVPVTVTVYEPAAAVPVLMVSVLELPAVTEAGLNDAVAPLGRPEALRFTVCALPEVTAVLMVLVPVPPCAILRLLGAALMEKSLTVVELITKVTPVV
jgi:hypothetical protein